MFYDWSDNENWENELHRHHGRCSRMPSYIVAFIITVVALQQLGEYIMA